MTTNNKPEAEVVENNKTKADEVVQNGQITQESIISDILMSDVSLEKKDEKPESPSTQTEKKDEKEISETKEQKEVQEGKSKEETKFFAKIGNREFKTQEELNQHITKVEGELSSQKGFNSWIVGAVKKMRPDLFKEDGSIKSDELQKIIKGTSEKVKEATDTIEELSGVSIEDLTEEQKEDIKKAREILKPLGVVFADDPKYKKMEEDLNRYRQKDLEVASEVITQFSQKHQNCKKADGTPTNFDEHRYAIGEIMEERGYETLEKAWKVYKVENDITEETSDSKKDDATKGNDAGKIIPVVTKKESGSIPSSGKKDVWDEVLSLR